MPASYKLQHNNFFVNHEERRRYNSRFSVLISFQFIGFSWLQNFVIYFILTYDNKYANQNFSAVKKWLCVKDGAAGSKTKGYFTVAKI